MSTIYDLSDANFNVNSISFSTPKPTGSGGKSVGIYFEKNIFRVSLPEMIQWGAADFKDPNGKGNGKFELTLQFPSEDYKSDETTIALKNMQAIEAKLLEAGQKNSKQWFGKSYTVEVLSALWSPMLKYPKNKATNEPDLNGAPGLRAKLPIWEGEWKSEVYNEDNEKLFPDPNNASLTPIDLLTKGVKTTSLLQCGGLWFANGKFGVTWKLLQAVIPKPKPSLVGTCFLKKKVAVSVEQVESRTQSAPLVRQSSSDAVQSTLVDDSDGEEEDEVPLKEEPVEELGQAVEEEEEEEVVAQAAAPVVVESVSEGDKKKRASKKAGKA
jgi:hypothetical protein